MINIAELLKNAPKDLKLYSPLCGHCKLSCILYDDGIRVIAHDVPFRFDKYGRFCSADDAECLLFPNNECRTWEEWKVPVEPKFKVGDWIVKKDGTPFYGGNYAEQVTLIEGDGYLKCIWFSSGTWLRDNDIRLWSIQDAKDGDVITNGKLIVIFNKLEEPVYRQHIIAYVGLDLGGKLQITEDTWRLGVDKAMPATKEQRDLLFAKIKEAGYEWDEKEKELCRTINPKFKVGDNIKTGNTVETIAEVGHAIRRYYCESGRTISFENQDLWHLAPKPHYGIKNFHAGMPVLVRADNNCRWDYSVFSRITGNEDWPFAVCNGVSFTQCIPFEGNEHLLGATDMPNEMYINW